MVSYLNTAPLVWGLEHTSLGDRVRLEYALPSVCADHLRDGVANIGIVPVIEVARQGLDWLPSTGIACEDTVRSILLISKVPLTRIRTLAADTGSRSSVMLARILLGERYGVEPVVSPFLAHLPSMLDEADAALVIGDPALHLEPEALRERYEVLDLGHEWVRHTGLPMVFAVWAGRRGHIDASLDDLFVESCRYGMAHIEEILQLECPNRGIGQELARDYLTHHITYLLEKRHHDGMREYLRLAQEFESRELTTYDDSSRSLRLAAKR